MPHTSWWRPSIVSLIFLSSPLAAQTKPFEWTGSVPPGGSLQLFSGNGRIDVIAGDGDRVEVVGERLPRRSGQDEVALETVRDGSDVILCAVTDYTECRSGGIHKVDAGRSHNPREVRFTILLPPGTHVRVGTGRGAIGIQGGGGDVRARSGNGEVRVLGTTGSVNLSSGNGELEVERATGPVRAWTGNGAITIREAGGAVSASSGNGAIRVSLTSLVGDGALELRTGSGPVELRLPAELDARLRARLGHGKVLSDFPMTVAGALDFRDFQATIGRGGPRIVVASGNGDAILRRR